MRLVYIISAGVESLRVPLTASCTLWKTYGIRSRISFIKKSPSGGYGPGLNPQQTHFPGMFRRVLIVVSEKVLPCSADWGYAQPGRKDIFVLVNRFNDPREDLFLGRVYKAVSFLFGLSIGLEQCSDSGCLMYGSQSAEDLDNRGFDLCHECRAKLSSRIRDVIS